MSEWERGFAAGYAAGLHGEPPQPRTARSRPTGGHRLKHEPTKGWKKKQKPSAYNNFVAKKSQLPRFKYKSSRGKKKKGMVNLKAIGVAWRKLSPTAQKKWK